MFYRNGNQGIIFFVRLTTRSDKDAIVGTQIFSDNKTYLQVRVRARAAKRQANRALIKFLAHAMKIPPSAFTIISGTTSCFKQLRLLKEYTDLFHAFTKNILDNIVKLA